MRKTYDILYLENKLRGLTEEWLKIESVWVLTPCCDARLNGLKGREQAVRRLLVWVFCREY
jgi:hypothetical protein